MMNIAKETQEYNLNIQVLMANKEHYIDKSIEQSKNTIIHGKYDKTHEDKLHYNTLKYDEDYKTLGNIARLSVVRSTSRPLSQDY